MKRGISIVKIAAALSLFVLGFAPNDALAQPRFGIEAAIGQGFGATAYVDNAAYLNFDTPTLADELPGNGATFALQLVFDSVEANLTVQLFDRERVRITHVSDDTLPPDRVRPDRTIDDAGIEYRKLDEPRTITVPDRSRGSLVVGTLGAAYRWYFFSGDRYDLYVPIGGGLSFAHVNEASRPWVFGLFGFGGLAASFDVAPPVGLFASARLNGLLTPSYLDFEDASRAAIVVGDSTEAAAFDTMLYGSILVGLQFTVR